MKTPFPGMDPYLEQSGVWNQIHANLIVDIQRFLAEKLEPTYYVIIEQLTYLSVSSPNGHTKQGTPGKPDVLILSTPQPSPSSTVTIKNKSGIEPIVAELPMAEEVKHRYLKIKRASDNEVVTVIEILSPANKMGQGRKVYEEKRYKVLNTKTNLVEIDLLRRGDPMPINISETNDYRIMVSCGDNRPWADVYLFGIRDAIPDFPIPLQPNDTKPILPLNDILHTIYEQGRYYLFVDYTYSLTPPISEADGKWVESLMKTP